MKKLSTYTECLNADTGKAMQEAQEYGGQLVARSFDGKDVYAYAWTEDELEERLRQQNIDPAGVVVSRIARKGESDIF